VVGEAKEVNDQRMRDKPAASNMPTAHLVRTLLEMGELQLLLLRADTAAATRATYVAVVLLVLAACLLVAAAPVLLLAAAAWIEQAWGFSWPASLAIAGGGATALACVLLAGVRLAARRGLSVLSRTVDELARNIESVKQGLADSHGGDSQNGSVETVQHNPSRGNHHHG
jgi:hypothetical protein